MQPCSDAGVLTPIIDVQGQLSVRDAIIRYNPLYQFILDERLPCVMLTFLSLKLWQIFINGSVCPSSQFLKYWIPKWKISKLLLVPKYTQFEYFFKRGSLLEKYKFEALTSLDINSIAYSFELCLLIVFLSMSMYFATFYKFKLYKIV